MGYKRFVLMLLHISKHVFQYLQEAQNASFNRPPNLELNPIEKNGIFSNAIFELQLQHYIKLFNCRIMNIRLKTIESLLYMGHLLINLVKYTEM